MFHVKHVMEFYYNDDFYNPANLATLKQRTLRSEYNRLRKEANMRLQRFEGTKWTRTKIYKSNAGRYDQNISKMTNKELRYMLTQVHDFLASSLSTVEGNVEAQERSIKTLKKHGINITKRQYIRFGEYMEKLRIMYNDALYDSRTAAKIYAETGNVDEAIRRYEEYEMENKNGNAELQ